MNSGYEYMIDFLTLQDGNQQLFFITLILTFEINII